MTVAQVMTGDKTRANLQARADNTGCALRTVSRGWFAFEVVSPKGVMRQ
jgi:hypothetical protein